MGGFAHRTKHYISIHKFEPPERITEIVIHETAHKIHFNFPKETKKYIYDWFTLNVASKISREKLLSKDLSYKIFNLINQAFFNRYGFRLWDIMDILNDVELPEQTIIDKIEYREGEERLVRVKKSFVNSEGKRIPKGTYLKFSLLDGNITIAKRNKKNEIVWHDITFDYEKADKYLEFTDIEDIRDIEYKREVQELGFDGMFRGRFNVLTSNALYLKIDDTVSKDSDFKNIGSLNLGHIIQKLEPVFASIKKGMSYGDIERKSMDILQNINVTDVYGKDEFAIKSLLGKPEGDLLKKVALSLGTIPSAYSASDSYELWAELVTYLTTNISKVSKELKQFFRNVVMGKF
jgi:hypothetical protein